MLVKVGEGSSQGPGSRAGEGSWLLVKVGEESSQGSGSRLGRGQGCWSRLGSGEGQSQGSQGRGSWLAGLGVGVRVQLGLVGRGLR